MCTVPQAAPRAAGQAAVTRANQFYPGVTGGQVGRSDPMPQRGRGRVGRPSGQRLLSRVCYSFNNGKCQMAAGTYTFARGAW